MTTRDRIGKPLSLAISALMITSLTMAIFLMTAPLASAADLLDVTATPTDSKAGVTTTYTIQFTTVGDIVATTGTITITFPAGYDISAVVAGDVSVTDDGVAYTPTSVAIDGTARTVTITAGSAAIAGGSAVVVTIADHVKNPTAGSYTITIDTSAPDTGTADVTITPDLTAVSATPTSTTAGVLTSYDIAFTTTEDIVASTGTITITFPVAADEYDISAVVAGDVSVTDDGSAYTTTSVAIDSGAGTVTITAGSATIAGGSAVVVTIATDHVKNPTVAGDYTITIDTSSPDAGSCSVTIIHDVKDHYNVVPELGPYTAGVAFNVTITVVDQYNNPLGADYAEPEGTYTWETTAGTALDGTTPVIGTISAAKATLTTGSGETAIVYTAVAAGPEGNDITIAYTEATADSALIVSVSASAISVEMADTAGTISSTAADVVTAINADAGASALVTASLGDGGTGTMTTMTATPLSGGSSSFEDIGVAVMTVTLYKAESGVTFTASEPSPSTVTGTSDPITVDPAAHAAYTVVPDALTQTAGSAFNVDITAVDSYENPIPTIDTTLNSYTFIFSGPADAPDGTTPTYPTTPAFSSGVWICEVTLVKAESVALTVEDSQGTSMAGTSASITVDPAAKLIEFEAEVGGKTATVKFSGGVYTNIDTGALTIPDDLTYTNAAAGGATSMSHIAGENLAVVRFDAQVESTDIATDSISVVASQIFDSFGNFVPADTKAMADDRDEISLENGWNLVSLPKVPSAGWDIVSNAPSLIEIYTYENGHWIPVTDADSLDAVFIKANGPQELALSWTTDPKTAPPLKFLGPFWNLVGTNMEPTTEIKLKVETMLDSVTIATQYEGWSTVFSPSYNLLPWTCVSTFDASGNVISNPESYMLTYEGYWVYMQREAGYAGRTT